MDPTINMSWRKLPLKVIHSHFMIVSSNLIHQIHHYPLLTHKLFGHSLSSYSLRVNHLGKSISTQQLFLVGNCGSLVAIPLNQLSITTFIAMIFKQGFGPKLVPWVLFLQKDMVILQPQQQHVWL